VKYLQEARYYNLLHRVEKTFSLYRAIDTDCGLTIKKSNFFEAIYTDCEYSLMKRLESELYTKLPKNLLSHLNSRMK
jgi:hypothetical protein